MSLTLLVKFFKDFLFLWDTEKQKNKSNHVFEKYRVSLPFLKTLFRWALQMIGNENLIFFFMISVWKRMFYVCSKRKQCLTSGGIAFLVWEAKLTRVSYKPVSYKKHITCFKIVIFLFIFLILHMPDIKMFLEMPKTFNLEL